MLARVSETEEGRNGRERQEKDARLTSRSLPQRPSSTTAYGGGPPSPEGKVKSFPFGGAGRALALTEEGRSERERYVKSAYQLRTALSRKAPLPPLRRSPFPVGEGWEKCLDKSSCYGL